MCLRWSLGWATNEVGLAPPPGVPSGSANDGQSVMISYKNAWANTKVMARAPCMDTQAIENRRFYCVPLFLLPEGVVAVACRTDSRSREQSASDARRALGCGLSLSPRLFVRPLSL